MDIIENIRRDQLDVGMSVNHHIYEQDMMDEVDFRWEISG